MCSPTLTPVPVDFSTLLDTAGPTALTDAVSAWLGRPPEEGDRAPAGDRLAALCRAVRELNARAAATDPDRPTAEGSNAVHQVTRLSERATADAAPSDVDAEDLRRYVIQESVVDGRLAVLLCRYRRRYPEGVGFLGMTQGAAGWFHKVMGPASESTFMRQGMARNALLRLSPSARCLDERLAQVGAAAGGTR